MAFDSTPYSMLKTVVMMIGEYEFEGIFTEHDNPEDTEAANLEAAKMIPFPTYSSLVFLAFVFVMSIIIMNLMVGLAVDDITEIQNNAELQKLSLNVSLIFDERQPQTYLISIRLVWFWSRSGSWATCAAVSPTPFSRATPSPNTR